MIFAVLFTIWPTYCNDRNNSSGNQWSSLGSFWVNMVCVSWPLLLMSRAKISDHLNSVMCEIYAGIAI